MMSYAAATPPTHPTGPGRYSALAIALHWLLALLILGTFSFGVYMVDLPFSPGRIRQFNWHKWAGITILAFSGVRLLWRLANRPPALPPMPTWQVTLSHLIHGLMYLLFFMIPLAGWSYSSAAGFPVVYFGVLPLPDLVGRSKELAELLKQVHVTLAYSLAALVAMHVAAAFKHHWVDRDRLLDRMNPFARRHVNQGTTH